MKEEQSKIEYTCRYRLPVHMHMFFDQMPAARADDQGGDRIARR